MSCPEFIGKSFAMRSAVHTAHLRTKSFSQHEALGEFYEGLIDKVDRLAEIHLAENSAATFPSYKPPMLDELLPGMREYLKAVRAEQAEEKSHKAKENIITEIEELTLRTLYKLQRFA